LVRIKRIKYKNEVPEQWSTAAAIGVAESTEMQWIFITRFMLLWRFPEKGLAGFCEKIIKNRNIVACAGIEGVQEDISAEKLFQSSLSHLIFKVTFIGFSSL